MGKCKEVIAKVLLRLSNKLKDIALFLTAAEKAGIVGGALTPKILEDEKDLERVRPYLSSLENALKANGVNNIAVTGGYGSGKSTILRTLQHHNSEGYKYLNISLASFNDSKADKESLESRLEVSILQQMFYHVEPSIIPDSRFRRIVNVTEIKLATMSLLLVLWLLSAIVLFKFSHINRLNPATWSLGHSVDYISFISSLFFFSGVAYFVWKSYRLFANSRINKLSIKGELELGEAIDKSVFNQHVEEILYFFEKTNFNVVVIEDVDRFSNTNIFIKLREINTLVNNCELIKRPVKFIYAIKDDVFRDKNERVKFFDYVVPIIPFINPSNAQDQLTKLFESADLKNTLSSDFASDVVTFIDDIDMRLLSNIFNEYKIYRQILGATLKQDNLFAILVYKNMYPEDFGKLSQRKGKLYSFFANKGIYVDSLQKDIKKQIEQLDEKIRVYEEEAKKDVKELRAVYINLAISKIQNFHSFYLDKEVKVDEALGDEFFDNLVQGKSIQYVGYGRRYDDNYRRTGVTDSNITLTDLEKDISPNLTYIQRESLAMDTRGVQIDRLKGEREILKAKLSEIEMYSIQEIFTHLDINSHIKDFEDSYLMRSLLLNGYIDENYEDYITLFHEVSITRSDFEFERSIKGGKALHFDYTLNHTANLVKRIPEKYFAHEVALNYNIVDYLLDSESRNSAKLEAVYRCLRLDGDRQFQFIYGYIHSNPKQLPSFIKSVVKYKTGFWQYLKHKSGLPSEELGDILKLIFEHSAEEDIMRLEDLDSLDEHLRQMPDIFVYASAMKSDTGLRNFIEKRGLRFVSLDNPTKINHSLFDFIYKGKHYEINENNILSIVSTLDQNFEQHKYKNANYTSIVQSGLVELNSYIKESLEYYVANVMLAMEGNVNEDEETIVNLLNDNELDDKTKIDILQSQSCIIKDISAIKSVHGMELVMSKDKIKPVWDNVYHYMQATGIKDINKTLADFLNRSANYNVLSKTVIDDKLDDFGLSDSIIYGRELALSAYESLLSSISYEYNQLDYSKIDKQKVEKLIHKGILALTKENYIGLKEFEGSLCIRLAERSQEDFASRVYEFQVDNTDWLEILRSKKFSVEYKLRILSKIEDTIIINSPEIAKAIFDVLPSDSYMQLSYEVLEAICSAGTIISKKVELLLLHFSNLEDGRIQALIEKLGENYAAIFSSKEKQTFDNTEYNVKLFYRLKQKGVIKKTELIDEKKSIRVTPIVRE